MSRLYSISSNKLNYEGVMFGNGLLEFELNLYVMEEPVTKSIWNTKDRAKIKPLKNIKY